MITERQMYYRLTNDWQYLPDFLDHFDSEAKLAKTEITMSGSIERIAKDLPVIMDLRFTQLQILNAAIEYFEKQHDQIKSKHYKKYLEHYQRQLSSRDVEKYVSGEQEVVDLAMIINEIALMRNIFISITKSIDAKQFQIHNITKLRTSGLDDATID